MIRVLPPPLTVLVSLAASALLGGCAHDAADRHANEMRDGITRLQSETDRLGLAADDEAPSAVARAERGRAGDGGVKLPIPRTIQLGGADGDGEDDDPNAPNARPKIELSGPPGAAARPSPPSRGRERDRDRAPSTGRARDTRIEMLGPVPEGEEPAPAPPASPASPAATDPARPDADAPKAAPKPDAPRRRGDKGRPSDSKATTKETR